MVVDSPGRPERTYGEAKPVTDGVENRVYSMNFVFPQEAIDFLRRCQYDPAAQPMYEMLSGGLTWDDEYYFEFAALCRAKGCPHYGVLFAYRSSLILGQPYEEYRYAWEEVRLRCPEWIGFRPERSTPNVELQEFLRGAEEDY